MAGDREPTYRPTERWPTPPAFDHVLVRPAALAAETEIVLRDDAVTAPGGRSVFLSDHYGVASTITV
jgi:hypothetical protein